MIASELLLLLKSLRKKSLYMANENSLVKEYVRIVLVELRNIHLSGKEISRHKSSINDSW